MAKAIRFPMTDTTMLTFSWKNWMRLPVVTRSKLYSAAIRVDGKDEGTVRIYMDSERVGEFRRLIK